jgi:UDP-N-acetylmuramoyl-L-alanyl-D-glutamate--2,6-diaminopimelate ligase
MRIDELLEGVDALDMSNLYPDMVVSSVTCDSREVGPGAVFVAIPGEAQDGHDYIVGALAEGATLVVQSRPIDPEALGSFLRVHDPRAVYAELCARLRGYPSRELRVVGITGTNGKTSTTLIARHLLNSAGCKAAALGTLGLLRPDAQEFEGRGLTTPDAARLQNMLRSLVDEGTTHLLMEVSSHSLVQQRVAGVEFAGGVFTNLTQDHFDYHGTFANYAEAKSLLFTKYLAQSGGYAVLNADDPVGAEYAARFAGVKVLYGTDTSHNLVIARMDNSSDGISWELVLKNGVWPATLSRNINHASLHSSLVGRYNVYNCTAAAAIALFEGLTLGQVVEGLASFPGVPGRLQRVPNNRGIHTFVDYAHTPDALSNVLAALAELRGDGARIICVIGCGGDRDRGKRPLMGSAAQRGADHTIITSDNPRNEDPQAIIDEILTGIEKRGHPVQREPDRRLAIQQALAMAYPGDLVLIAGKGHEDYQILGAQTVHFSDYEEALEWFERPV